MYADRTMQDVLKRWPAMAASFYFALFFAATLAFAAPALLASLFPGVEISRSEVFPFGWVAGAAAADMTREIEPITSAASFLIPVLVLCGGLALRRFGWPAVGLISSLYGFAICQPLFMAVMFGNRKPGVAQAVTALLGACCLLMGFVYLLDGLEQRIKRFLFLVVGFILPAMVGATQLLRMPRRATGSYIAGETLFAVVMAFVAVYFKPNNVPAQRPTTILYGLLFSLLLGADVNMKLKRQAEERKSGLSQQLLELPAPMPKPYEKVFMQKGVSLTAEFPAFYGERASRRMLSTLPDFGVNAIALIPYGPLRRERSMESDIGLEILTRQAHQQGMKVMLKPHMRKPSEGELAGSAAIDEWFRNHETFIVEYARFAERTHSDLFCIGTEFGWLSKFETPWRRIIGEVRKVYGGPLVYAPNHGPEFESVQFWDALDYIGIDNYYPLTDEYTAGHIFERIEKVQTRFGKPVLFTEAGYSAAVGAHKEPWADETNYPLSLDEQARCYETLLRTFYDKPWFHGVYWWKVGTNGYGGPNNNSMTPWRKPAMEVLKRYYLSPVR